MEGQGSLGASLKVVASWANECGRRGDFSPTDTVVLSSRLSITMHLMYTIGPVRYVCAGATDTNRMGSASIL